MQFNEYQKKAIVTDLMGKKLDSALDASFLAKLLGLVGEAGEVAEKFKKIIRDKDAVISTEDRKEIIKELGDILWYISALSYYMDTPLQDVAETNLEKVLSRKERGVSRGSGDNR